MLLESMKKGIGKYVMIVLASLLILSFAVWGIGDMAGVISNPNEVATVGDTKITQREFQEQFRSEMERIRGRVGNIDVDQARKLGVADATVNGLVARRLLELQAAELGLLVSDEQLRRQIRRNPTFRNALGEFDPSIFRTTLANNGLSEGAYVASLRQGKQQDYVGGVITAGAKVPEILADTVYKYRNEKRSAEIVKIKRGRAGGLKQPSDTELQAFMDENSTLFMAPEYRKFSLLFLDPVATAKELSPSAERIQEEYQDRLSSLSIPERRRLEQILVKDEEAAKRAHALLREGKTFGAVAKEISGKSGDDIKLGLVVESDLLPDLAKVAFALQKDGFGNPIKSPLGWHIFRVTEIQERREPSLDEVRKIISDDISRDLALDELVKRADQVEDALAGGADIDDAAKEAGVRVRKVQFINAEKKLQTDETLDGLPADPSFVEIAFTTEKGQTSDLIETSGGGYFMLRVDEIKEAAKRPLSEVREQVETAWEISQLNAVAKKTAEEIRDRAKGGTPLAEIAASNNLTVEKPAAVARFYAGGTNAIPPTILAGLFKAKVGDVVMAPTQDGYAVARLKDIENAKIDYNDGDLKDLREALTAGIANDILQEYTHALRQEYSVSIHQAALDAYFSNQGYGRGR